MSSLVLVQNALAERLGVDKDNLLAVVKQQCFRGISPDQVTNSQLIVYCQVAHGLNLNPMLPGMLYAYPERNGGVTPVIGPDGVFTMLASHPNIRGWSCKHETIDGQRACTATIKHEKLGEVSKTVFFDEWVVPNNPNWRTRPRHMLEIRALKQAARQCIHGIPFDSEEYEMAKANEGDLGAIGAGATGAVGDAGEGGEKTRPKAPARRGGAAAAKAEAKPDATIDVSATPTGDSSQGDSGAAPQASATASTSPAPSSDSQPSSPPEQAAGHSQAASPAAEKPAEKAANATVDVQSHPTPPDVAPGVSYAGFHGKTWPVLLNLKVTALEPAVTPNNKPILKLTVEHEKFKGDVLSWEGVEIVPVDPAKPDGAKRGNVTKPFLKVGSTINGNLSAKLRPSKEKDDKGQPKPDYTKAPALFLADISEASQEEEF